MPTLGHRHAGQAPTACDPVPAAGVDPPSQIGGPMFSCRVPVTVRDDRFAFHDGYTVRLADCKAEIRLPAGADLELGDTVQVLFTSRLGPGQALQRRTLARAAAVLSVTFEEEPCEADEGDAGDFLRVCLTWDAPLDPQTLL